MRTAMVIMTILGCDDSTTDCQYVATLNQRWPSVELCNAVSEKELSAFANVSYPVVIAVCQDPTVASAATTSPSTVPKSQEVPADFSAVRTLEEQREEERSMAAKAVDRVNNMLPTRGNVENLIKGPVRIVENGYSWVAQRLR